MPQRVESGRCFRIRMIAFAVYIYDALIHRAAQIGAFADVILRLRLRAPGDAAAAYRGTMLISSPKIHLPIDADDVINAGDLIDPDYPSIQFLRL